MAIIRFQKKYTELLCESIERFRLEYPQYQKSKITYAGRLDPMAEGELLLLTDADVHLKDSCLGRDKVYEVDVAFGFFSDTYDILGLPSIGRKILPKEAALEKVLNLQCHLNHQVYPIFSSKTVKGKPLYQWAREGRIHEIDLPKRAISVHDAVLLEIGHCSWVDFISNVISSVSCVAGDFRQQEIIAAWNELNFDSQVLTARIRYHVSSGTYIRDLIHSLGKDLGVGALCVKINRVEICTSRDDGIQVV